MGAIFLYGLVALFDGVSIGSGDFRHLPRTNFLAMVTCVTALVTVRSDGTPHCDFDSSPTPIYTL